MIQFRIKTLAIAIMAFGAMAAPAQEGLAWWGQYRLQGDYLRTPYQQDWILSQDFDGSVAGFLFDPRLGSWEVTAGATHLMGQQNGMSDSAAALSRWGAALNLFPYRRFPLTLYYGKDSRPEVFGYPQADSTRFGGRLAVLTRSVGTMNLSYDNTDYQFGDRADSRSVARFTQNRRYGRFSEDVSVEDHKFTYPQYDFQMRLGQIGLRYDLKEGNYLYSTTRYQKDSSDTYFSEVLYEDLQWVQKFRQKWTLLSWAGFHDGKTPDSKFSGLNLSAMLQWQPKVWSGFSGVAYSSVDAAPASGPAESLTTMQVFGGASRPIGSRIRMTLDGAVGQESRTPEISGVAGGGSLMTLHFGVSSGDGLPSWASHLAYRYRTIPFERRLSEQFPPGYANSEVQALKNEYYIRTHSGASGVGGDLYYTQGGDGSKVIALVGSGHLQFNHTLGLRSRLDFRQEKTNLGSSDLASLWIGADYNSLRGYTLGGTLTFSKASSQYILDPAITPSSPSTYDISWTEYGAGIYFSRKFGAVPLNTQLLYSSNSRGYSTLLFRAETLVQVRLLTLRLVYQYANDGNNYDSHRLYIDLLRIFRGNR